MPALRQTILRVAALQFMSERGFQVYDICTFFRRPYDCALRDVIFVRSSSPLVASKRWA
jgi:hypothetical protein